MEIVYTIEYHSKVVRDDIPALSALLKTRARQAIENKLMSQPEYYGKPLRQSLRGYRKLRVGDYRVVFRIDGTTVFVLAILHRSVVYKNALDRA